MPRASRNTDASGATRRRRAAPRRRARHASAAQLAEAAGRLGIETLHPEQETVISDVLDGRDVLMVLPTGFGKSACYQIPSMLLPRPVVLVSPLLALLEDQHRKLVRREIPCVRLDGTVRGRARREALERITAGGSLLVMTTPETFVGPELEPALRGSGVDLVAVDEAHCISEWGHDFRPAYRRVGMHLRDLGRPPLLALTATATPRVRETIVGALAMSDPRVVASSPHRSNLAFEVTPCSGDERLRLLLRLIQRLRRPGIVYCATRRDVDDVYVLLRRFEIPAHRYHGRMPAAERRKEQEGFMRRRRRSVMVATSAFGLGIDKPDIRYVLHAQSPASLEQYVQEAGRAGRDGRTSNCILLYDEADRQVHEALLARSRLRPEQLYRLGEALAHWADEERAPSLEALALSAEMGPRVAAGLVATLEEAGLVEREDDHVRALAGDTLEEDVRGLAGKFETLRTQDGRRLDALRDYAREKRCRAVVLREYFGEDTGEACGLCDVCRERGPRAERWFEPLAPPKREEPKKSRRGRGGRRGRRGGRSERRPRRAAGERRGPSEGKAASEPGGGRGGRKERAGAAGEAPAAGRRRRRGRRGSRGGRRSRKPRTPTPSDEG